MSDRENSIQQFSRKIDQFITNLDSAANENKNRISNTAGQERKKRKEESERAIEEIAGAYLHVANKSQEIKINDFAYYSPKIGKREIRKIAGTIFSPIALPVKAQDIIDEAQNRTCLPEVLIGRKVVEKYDSAYMLPVYYKWQGSDELHPKNFVINYIRKYEQEANLFTNNLLLRMLMAFDANDIRFSFIDPMITNNGSFFISHLEDVNKDIIHEQVLTSTDNINKFIEELNIKVQHTQRLLGHEHKSVVDFNNYKGAVLSSYEVIIIYESPERGLLDKLKPFIKNGYKTGIYFVVLRNIDDLIEASVKWRDSQELINKESFAEIDQKTAYEFCLNNDLHFYSPDYISEQSKSELFNLFDWSDLSGFFKDYFIRLKNRVDEKINNSKINFDLQKYVEDFNIIKRSELLNCVQVPIGLNDKRDADFHFVLDEKELSHAFILGKTGSGKSVLLHDIIAMSCLKYTPDLLQFYLIDLKKGGVEFKIYAKHNIPHASAVLLDDSDQQIVLEIFENLNKVMKQRGQLFNEINVRSLAEYNEKQPPEKVLPRIMVVVDECHKLFPDHSHSSFKIQAQIQGYIEAIATEGRSQGIHLIMATQTLANTLIPPKIKNNLNVNYLLKCNQMDAEARVGHDSAKQIKQLTSAGQTLYCAGNQHQIIQPYYLLKETDKESKQIELDQVLEASLKRVIDKNVVRTADELKEKYPSFVFSGTQKYRLEDKYPVYTAEKPAAIIGANIGMQFKIIDARFSNDDASNLLIAGGVEENVIPICISSMFSLLSFYKKNGRVVKMYVINFFDKDEMPDKWKKENPFLSFESERCIQPDGSKQIREALLDIRRHIRAGNKNQDIYLCIFAQQRFRELKNELEIDMSQTENKPLSKSELEDILNNWGDFDSAPPDNEKVTYKSILDEILLKGPEVGVHTILQVDKCTNLLFDDYWNPKKIAKLFSNIVLLNMPETHLTSLVNQELKVQDLSNEPDRVRAYYYNDQYSDRSELLVPFVIPEKEFINKHIN